MKVRNGMEEIQKWESKRKRKVMTLKIQEYACAKRRDDTDRMTGISFQ